MNLRFANDSNMPKVYSPLLKYTVASCASLPKSKIGNESHYLLNFEALSELNFELEIVRQKEYSFQSF